ncbi:MAG: 3-oxoacyl-ACP reductase FabG [Oscillospiraceae bacterium]|nr:3-oxoacyl-ACP reductase FabG [Oscillospiraceae bacterium]
MLLKDKIAIVTGGTRGIGYAIVKAYLENGATVVLCGSKPETAQKAVDQLKAENPAWKVEGISPNLTDYDSVKEAFDAVEKKYGRIDILVNNAGVSDSAKIGSYTPEMFQRTMDLNVNAMFYCIKAVVDGMKERHSGVILNTSSMVSKYAQPGGVAYPTSKFAVNGMTLSLARELAGDGIRVNAVAPGITKTDMVANLPEQMIAPLIAQIPLGRIGEPEDIANAFVFLASDMASYISGQVLGVDGLARA